MSICPGPAFGAHPVLGDGPGSEAQAEMLEWAVKTSAIEGRTNPQSVRHLGQTTGAFVLWITIDRYIDGLNGSIA